MNKQEHLDLIRENGYNVPEFVDTSDCISPFEDTPNLLIIGDDVGNVWEFVDGKMIGKGNLMSPSMTQIRSELEEIPESRRGRKFLKIQKEIRSLWVGLEKTIDLDRAQWDTSDDWR